MWAPERFVFFPALNVVNYHLYGRHNYVNLSLSYLITLDQKLAACIVHSDWISKKLL